MHDFPLFQLGNFAFSQPQEKDVVIKMYEEMASQAARMLILVFWVMVASIIVGSWILFRKKS
jgi:fatty acid desaturase